MYAAIVALKWIVLVVAVVVGLLDSDKSRGTFCGFSLWHDEVQRCCVVQRAWQAVPLVVVVLLLLGAVLLLVVVEVAAAHNLADSALLIIFFWCVAKQVVFFLSCIEYALHKTMQTIIIGLTIKTNYSSNTVRNND